MEHDGVILKPGERLDDLQNGGYCLIQHPEAFCFGTDAVLLADFASPKKWDLAVDLGCGTGAIATLMAIHCPQLKVDAVELQPEIADMARRSTILNHLSDRIQVYEGDMRGIWRILGAQKYSLAVCNPPYGRANSGKVSENKAVRLARHESDLDAVGAAQSAARLLKSGGRFCVVYPADRAFEMMLAMRENHLEPKRIRTVHSRQDRPPRRVLIDAVKDGHPTLQWLPPLVLQDENGQYTPEWKRIYKMQ